jgi:hypothetical protein
LFAQVLPLCATLQGLELLHASAVAVDGQIAAFAATSGTGKSTLATQLIARGATLVTDDVLAVELRGDSLVAHPGAGLISVDAAQYRELPRSGQERLGTIVGRSAHLLIGGRPTGEALPIRNFYFVRRDSRYTSLSVQQVKAPNPRELIASVFLLYVASPSRLENLLGIAAHLAEHVRVAEVLIPLSGTEPAAVAEAVERDFERA